MKLIICGFACITMAGCITRDVAMSAAREAGTAAVDRALDSVQPPPESPWSEALVGSLGAAIAVIGHRYWYHKRKANK